MTALRLIAVAALLALPGCERTFRDMYDQPRYKPLAASPLWSDGSASRPSPEGSVPYSEGTFAGSSSGRLGVITPAPQVDPMATVRDALRSKGAEDGGVPSKMVTMTAARLARGRDRFDVFCAPCHSIVGDGDGMVPRRGFPHPPSFHSDALRAASDEHFYAVISNGYGAMSSYATRLDPEDRLAVIAYVRALQLSRHAPLSVVPEAEAARLRALASGSAEKPR